MYVMPYFLFYIAFFNLIYPNLKLLDNKNKNMSAMHRIVLCFGYYSTGYH